MANVAVIGCGAWGTTLAKVLAENGHEVNIWCHQQAIADTINQYHQNQHLLPDITLPATITAQTDIKTAVQQAELIVLVTASQFFKATLLNIKSFIPQKAYLVSATKGLNESDDKRMSEIMYENLPEFRQNIAVLSGPNISYEIAMQKASTAVIASENIQTAKAIQKLFNNNNFRVYTNNDVIGTEMGGTLKNVIAIAAGIIDGLEMGNNTKAALMVRGMVEMSKLAVTLGAKPETLFGLTGMGDLITTCSSSLSRNHRVGVELARGKKIDEIIKNMNAVAEGVATTKAAHDLAKKLNVAMPITEQMYQVIYEHKSIPDAVKQLMARDLKSE